MYKFLISIFLFLSFGGLCLSAELSEQIREVQEKRELAQQEMQQEEALEELKEQTQKVETVAVQAASGVSFAPLGSLVEKEKELLDGYEWRNLKVFGSDVFSKINLELSRIPVYQRKVPEDYKLGPGDKLRIHLWNQTEDKTLSVGIGVDGNIQFPLAGEIQVQGIEKENLQKFLIQNLSRFYKNLKLTFEIIELRKFPIYVTGEAKVPGVYIGTALSTPLQLLMANGGPNERGSLRNLQIIRSGKVVQTVDLYEFLLHGKLKSDFFLKSEDVLHIPIASRRIAILGRVKRQGIYELKQGEGYREAVKYAGSFEADAVQSNLQLISFDRLGRPKMVDVDFKYSSKVDMQDGDILLVPASHTLVYNKVKISGNVFSPGNYQWKPGLSVKDLVSKAQGLQQSTFLKRADLVRRLTTPDSFELNKGVRAFTNEKRIGLNLEDELSGKAKTKLMKGDEVYIYSLQEVQAVPRVEIIGVVNNPGSFVLQSDTRVQDILFQAQLNSSSHMERGEIHRQVETGVKVLEFHVEKALKGDPKENIRLSMGDVITIFENPQRRNLGRIELRGQVKFPGVYPFKTGERLADVLERAGGLLEGAYLHASRFYRESVRDRQKEIRDSFVKREKSELQNLKIRASGQKEEEAKASLKSIEQVENVVDKLATSVVSGRLNLNFDSLETPDHLENSPVNITLEDGDRFEVPLKPTEVHVLGQVFNPASLLFRQGFSIHEYLNQCGGLTESANKSKIYVVHADGSAVPAKEFRVRRASQMVSSVKKSPQDYDKLVRVGDTIIIPSQLKVREDRLAKTLDYTYKTAISVGALGGLFK